MVSEHQCEALWLVADEYTSSYYRVCGVRVVKERALEAEEHRGGTAGLLVQEERRGQVGV
ncbi:UNVERIFIED_CONTAM: hypothetical protein FKN15_026367 [Acipenser sinensis]